MNEKSTNENGYDENNLRHVPIIIEKQKSCTCNLQQINNRQLDASIGNTSNVQPQQQQVQQQQQQQQPQQSQQPRKQHPTFLNLTSNLLQNSKLQQQTSNNKNINESNNTKNLISMSNKNNKLLSSKSSLNKIDKSISGSNEGGLVIVLKYNLNFFIL